MIEIDIDEGVTVNGWLVKGTSATDRSGQTFEIGTEDVPSDVTRYVRELNV